MRKYELFVGRHRRDDAGWLAGVAELRRYHELSRGRSIWHQIEVADVPARDAQHRSIRKGAPGCLFTNSSGLHDVHGGFLGRRSTAVDGDVLGDLVLLQVGAVALVLGQQPAGPLVADLAGVEEPVATCGYVEPS